jgi:ADP-ribose pyrophosphatase YjhB (NUDIX family)
MRGATHKLAVGAFIIDNEKFLLLFRNSAPFLWAPPGGRLKKGENVLLGLSREVHEECNLDVKILCPVVVKEGTHEGDKITALFFICNNVNDKLKLSNENSEAKWFSIKDILDEDRQGQLFGDVKDYMLALKVNELLQRGEYE